MDSIRSAAILLLVSALSAGLAGCNDKIMDPTQIGRFRPTPAVNVILDSLGVAEEAPVAWEDAEEPQPGDVVAVRADYALRPGDAVRVSIYELYQEGAIVVNDFVVSETGQISIPDVGVIRVAGLTERQLEEQIKRILSPHILREPSVTVTLLDSQQRTFSVLGNAVSRPSRYVIPRYDFRLEDALATAGAQMQFNVSTVYVSRKGETTGAPAGAKPEKQPPELNLIEPGPQSGTQNKGQRAQNGGQKTEDGRQGVNPASVTRRPSSDVPNPTEPAQKFESEREMLDLITPRAQNAWPPSEKVRAGAPAGLGPSSMTASVMPGNLRVETLRKHFESDGRVQERDALATKTQGQDALATTRGPSPGREVLTPIEFGDSTPRELPPAETKPKERTEWVFRNGKYVQVVVTEDGSRLPKAGEPSDKPAAGPAGPGTGGDWTLRDGQWVRAQNGELPSANPAPAGTAKPAGNEGMTLQTRSPAPGGPNPNAARRGGEPERPLVEPAWEQATGTRVIRIPTDRLLAGDPRYNIIIKPGDAIHVPVDIIGEFSIMGNVNKTGYVDITGRRMTLKQAIAAAGGLGPLARPKNVEVIRRIGTAREEIVMVNLDKIASGEQPDFFIKPNDLINVGTEPLARFRAVLRNAFRATYGFGFVYDRNFADVDYYTGITHWF